MRAMFSKSISGFDRHTGLRLMTYLCRWISSGSANEYRFTHRIVRAHGPANADCKIAYCCADFCPYERISVMKFMMS